MLKIKPRRNLDSYKYYTADNLFISHSVRLFVCLSHWLSSNTGKPVVDLFHILVPPPVQHPEEFNADGYK